MTRIAVLILICTWLGPSIAAEDCSSMRTGNPLANANATTPVYFGRAADQVFLAEGRTISSITVWKSPTEGSLQTLIGSYICEAETLDNGDVRSLATRGILRTGPIVDYSIPHDTLAPLVFEFNPPVTLPHEGHFAFAIRDEKDCFGIFGLEVSPVETYAGGDLWTTGPLASCAYGAFPGFPVAAADLCFEIEYCDVVAARAKSWGEIRAFYRN